MANRWIPALNRRDLFQAGALGALLSRLPLRAAQGAKTAANPYARLGVKPIVNCKGTFTIVSGSQSLPEVKAAMDAASRHYVHLDELMDGVGRRLAEVTKAEWGIITAGCAAALTHATAACIAGADPEKMQRLPNLAGLKNEVVMPRPSRNVYDHAIRMLGVEMVTPTTREEYIAALRPQTAMVALLGETVPRHPMPLEEMCAEARKRGIPVIVDAAAERLTIPNAYLTKGVDMVAYSGGKCLRGPQCAGLLLGRKDLLQAAWLNSAPHHAFGRSLKVGKEEIMGMLAAVEAWTQRDHDAEWKQWEGWLATIREKVSSVPTVKTEILQPRGPSNYAPQLRITWDTAKVGITGLQAADYLWNSDPRMIVPGAEDSLTVMPYMMMPGDDAIAARRIHEVLSKPPAAPKPAAGGEAGSVAGHWDIHIEFVRGAADHTLFLEQAGDRITGHHRGDILAGDVRGQMKDGRARFRSSHRYEGTSLGYDFDGTLSGGMLTGTVDMGEYGKAKFTARKHRAG